MTMQEKLQIHEEIEKSNDKLARRWKLKNIHYEMVMNGQMQEAREVLRLLRRGRITLWLDDISWNVQTALENNGFQVIYSRNGNKAYACA